MPGVHFEISIDGKPRTYRDTKEGADQAAAVLKKQHPNSDVVVRDPPCKRCEDAMTPRNAGMVEFVTLGDKRAASILIVAGCSRLFANVHFVIHIECVQRENRHGKEGKAWKTARMDQGGRSRTQGALSC
jgi:hypothetical protein